MRIQLHRTHRTLFALYMIAGVMQLWDAYNMLLRPEYFSGVVFTTVLSIAPLWVYGVISLFSGLLILFGLASGRWTVIRVGFFIAFLYTAFFSFGFWVRYFTGDSVGAAESGKWSALVVAMYFILKEPPVNLLTVNKTKKVENGHRNK